MHLYYRHADRPDRIVKRDRGVGIATGIQQNGLCSLQIRLVQPVDQHAFVVGLAAFDAQAKVRRLRCQPCMNVIERVIAINFRFARAEQVEIGAGQDIDDRQVGQGRAFGCGLMACPYMLAAL